VCRAVLIRAPTTYLSAVPAFPRAQSAPLRRSRSRLAEKKQPGIPRTEESPEILRGQTFQRSEARRGKFQGWMGGFRGIGRAMEKGRKKPPIPGACAGCPNTGGRPMFLGSDIKKNKRFVGGWAQFPFGTVDQAGSAPACG